MKTICFSPRTATKKKGGGERRFFLFLYVHPLSLLRHAFYLMTFPKLLLLVIYKNFQTGDFAD